jgi:hypothetical protein
MSESGRAPARPPEHFRGGRAHRQEIGDMGIVDKAMKLGEGCAIRIYGDEDSGLAFGQQ